MKNCLYQILTIATLAVALSSCGTPSVGSAPCTGAGGLHGAVCADPGATRHCDWMLNGPRTGHCLCTGVPLAWLCKQNDGSAGLRPRYFPDDKPAGTVAASRISSVDLCASRSVYNVNLNEVEKMLNSNGVDIVSSSGTTAVNYVGSIADLAKSIGDSGTAEISVSSDFVCNAGTALQTMGVSDDDLNALYVAVFGR